MADLARAARQPSWWSKYRGEVPPAFYSYLEYEAAASAIWHYESFLVPGLLQTRDYAHRVISVYKGNFSSQTIQTGSKSRWRGSSFSNRESRRACISFSMRP